MRTRTSTTAKGASRYEEFHVTIFHDQIRRQTNARRETRRGCVRPRNGDLVKTGGTARRHGARVSLVGMDVDDVDA